MICMDGINGITALLIATTSAVLAAAWVFTPPAVAASVSVGVLAAKLARLRALDGGRRLEVGV